MDKHYAKASMTAGVTLRSLVGDDFTEVPVLASGRRAATMPKRLYARNVLFRRPTRTRATLWVRKRASMQIGTPSRRERRTRGWFVLLALVSGCAGGDAQREPDSGSGTRAEASVPYETGTSGGDATALGDSLVADGNFDAESGPGLGGSLLDGSLDQNTSSGTACSDNAAAYCAHLQMCSQMDLQILYGDMGTCTTQQNANCLAALAAPADGDNPSDIEDCAQAYAGWSCVDFLDDVNVPAKCRQARGFAQLDDPCAFNSQCATGYCAINPGSACGNCAHAPLPDDGCFQLPCGQGLLCYGAACVPLATSGALCDDAHHACGAGLSCVGGDLTVGVAGKCQPAVEQAGAACDPTQFTAAGCDLQAGLTCNPTTKKCDAVASAPGARPCNALHHNEVTPCGAAGQCALIGPGVVGMEPPGPDAGPPIPVNFFIGLCSPAAPVGGNCDTDKGPPCIAGSRCIYTSNTGTAGTCQVANASVCPAPVKPTGDGGIVDGAADAAVRHIEMRPITEFAALSPGQLAVGADKNIWYATSDTSIGRISPAGVVTLFDILSGARISAIAAGIDGKIWWLDSKNEFVGRMALDGTGAEWKPVPPTQQRTGPVGITAGPGAMWFTQDYSRQIGSVTSTWAFKETSLNGQIPGDFDIVDGPDGNLWFTTYNNSMCRVTPAGVPTCFPVPTPPNANQTVYTQGLAVGPDGNIWFTTLEPQTTGATIGRMTPAGSVTLFPLPDASCEPEGITAGPDGNLWFCERAADYVGRITPTGDITEFPIPGPGAQAGSIVTGADGKLWFSEPGVDKIGTIAP